MSSVAACGLQLYSFGPTISVPFWTDKWRPDSYYDKLKLNLSHGQHTLCLLDIKVKEQSEENLIKCAHRSMRGFYLDCWCLNCQ